MFRRSLAFRLLWLTAAAATLPALVITLVLRSLSSNILQISIQRQQTELARRVANEVNGEIRYAQGLLAFTARSPQVMGNNLAEAQRGLHTLIRMTTPFQEAMIVSETGEELVKVSRRGMGRPEHRTENVQERAIGAPFFSGNRLPTILITEPIPGVPGKPQRALVAKMSFASLGSLMQQTSVALNGNAFIVDRRGALLAHPDAAQVLAHGNLSRSPVVQDWLNHLLQPTRLFEYTSEKKSSMVAVAYPIPLLKSAVVVEQPKDEVYAPLERMRTAFLRWTSLSLVFFIGLAVAIAWRILQPLRQLQRAADQVAQGNMNVKLKIHTGDELEELGKAFTKMADSLRQLEDMRRDLISMVIHDLKSPLSSILASVDYCLSGEAGELTAEQKRFLTVGFRSGHDLLILIDNLLDVAKMEEGKLSLHKEAVHPVDWIERVVSTFKPIAAGAKKKLELAVESDLPAVDGDPSLLSRVLGNLLSNALRHTTSGTGEVRVFVHQQESFLAVEVQDNGQGIPPEYLDRIFEKFVQVERKRAHVRTGTGLGLTFCKMVVEAHGGRIYVQSVPNQGSTFTFLLPLSVPVPAPVESEVPESAAAASVS